MQSNLLVLTFLVSLLLIFTSPAPTRPQFLPNERIKEIEFNSSKHGVKRLWVLDSGRDGAVLFKVTMLEMNITKNDQDALESAKFVITDSNNDSVVYRGTLRNLELRVLSKFLRIEFVSPPSLNQGNLSAKFTYELIDPSTRSISTFCNHIKGKHHQFWPCKTRFRSPNCSETICVPTTEICDGINQCPNGEDEDSNLCDAWNSTRLQAFPPGSGKPVEPINNASCPKETFHCYDDAKCILPTKVCDGTQDCLGCADESPSACEWKKNHADNPKNKVLNLNDSSKAPCSEEFSFLCPNDHFCLPLTAVCNGITDCSDGFDEDPMVCKVSGEFDEKMATEQPENNMQVSEDLATASTLNETEYSTATTVESTIIDLSSNRFDPSDATVPSKLEKQETTVMKEAYESSEALNFSEPVVRLTSEPLKIKLNTVQEIDRLAGVSAQGTTQIPGGVSVNSSEEHYLIFQSTTADPFTESNTILAENTTQTETDEDVFAATTKNSSTVTMTTEKTSESATGSQRASELITNYMESLKELVSVELESTGEFNPTTTIFENSTTSSPLDETTQTSSEVGMTSESATESTNAFINSTGELESLDLKQPILARRPTDEEEIAFPPLWIAHVSSGSFFLCYGILLAGKYTSRWVLIPASCGRYLEPSSMRIHFGAGIDNYEVVARKEQINPIAKTGFSLLQLNSSEHVKHFIPQGINLTSSSINTETSCRLLAPRHGYIYSFQLQDVYPEDPKLCAQRYGIESSQYASCFSQNLCLQNGLGGILTCPNSNLGFYIEGADCYQGQIGWPVVVSRVTTDVLHWIWFTTGILTNICGYAPNEEGLSFPWYTYFNRTRNSNELCLAAYVENDTFPLVTSVLCLRQCMRSLLSKLDGNDGLEDGCYVENDESEIKLCPAKNITLKLSTPASPWKQCLVAYLDSPKQWEVRFERVRVSAFKKCAGERFYNPIMAFQGLCISAVEENGLLNCSSWGEAGLVQCQRSSDGLWEFLGFTQTCPSKKPVRRWFMRSLEL
ncbi:hypothetical protein Aperf_G00000009147 [Anoplocephala perfoliata]